MSVTEEFNLEQFDKTREALYKNPPIEPDLQRQIKTYTAKVQFVELKFSGINLHSRTIGIPEDAVPINDGELKKLLLTKMKLFQDFEKNSDFGVLTQIKKKVDILREDYLKPITCREGKSLIQVEMKQAFEQRLQKIQNEIKEVNKQLPDILETAIFQSKDIIRAELTNYLTSNPPEEIRQYSRADIRERKLNEFVDRIIHRINFPKTESLIAKIALNYFYYDLTYQDFSDDKLIQELQKKEIMKDEDIKGIVEMKNAFEERK